MGAKAEVGVGARTQVSKTVLKVFCKSSLEYLGTSIAVTGVRTKGGFVFEGPASYSKKFDLKSRKESEEVTEGVMEGHSQ